MAGRTFQPSRAYTLHIDNFTQGEFSFLAQEISFQTSADDLDLSQGLVAYYPLDESPFIEIQSGVSGVPSGTPLSSSNRFNQDNRSFSFDGSDDHVKGLASSLLPTGNSSRTMCAWIQSDDTNGMALRYGDILANNNGFRIYLNPSDSWSFWRYASDIDTLVSDNGK